MEELGEALNADDVDHGAAFDALRGLFADEDHLIEDLFGKDARNRLHDHEIGKRHDLGYRCYLRRVGLAHGDSLVGHRRS
jgi:hypothetical protein